MKKTLIKNISAVFGAAAVVTGAMYLATRPIPDIHDNRTDQALRDEAEHLFARKGYRFTGMSFVGRFPDLTEVTESLARNRRAYVGIVQCNENAPCTIREITPVK